MFLCPPRLSRLPASAALLLALGSACDDENPREPIKTVVLVTTDATSPRLLLGDGGRWETAPNLQAFFDDAVLFRNVLSPRGLTAVALSSLSTGIYPRDHGMRFNAGSLPRNTVTLPERFQEAGYRTLGYSANLCYVMSQGLDERLCTWHGELEGSLGLAERDALLVEQLRVRLELLPPDEKVFLWLHLNEPHKPFEKVSEWYQAFHPDPYEGQLDVSDVSMTYDVALGNMDFDEEDRRHMEAVYASQLRATDEHIGHVFDSLRAIGRYDEALVVFGIDHSEELAEHNNYFYHGCSSYNDVLGVLFAFRAPALPRGRVFEGWVSTVDIAPTMAEISDAFTWEGQLAGRSLLETIDSETEQDVPVFFERGVDEAGVIWGTDKYLLSGVGGNPTCPPYDEAGMVYPGELEELYDLDRDPGELENIVDQEPQLRDELRELVCGWVNESDWVSWEEVEGNELLVQCGEYE